MHVTFRAIVMLLGGMLLGACVPISTGMSEYDVSGLSELRICGSRVCLGDTSVEHLTPEQVQAAMRRLPGYTNTEMQLLWSGDGVAIYGWRPPDKRFIKLVLRDENAIALSRGLADRVTLGEAVEQFGTPSHVFVRKGANPVKLVASVSVFFQAQGLLLTVASTEGWSEFDITPDLRLHSYTLTSATDLAGMFSSALYPLYGPPETSLAAVGAEVAPLIEPWRGYGRYEVNPH